MNAKVRAVRTKLVRRYGEPDRLLKTSRAERVADWRDALQWPNDRKPIFVMAGTYAPARVAVIVALLPARTAVNLG